MLIDCKSLVSKHLSTDDCWPTYRCVLKSYRTSLLSICTISSPVCVIWPEVTQLSWLWNFVDCLEFLSQKLCYYTYIVCSPSYINQINQIESVQRRYTKLIPICSHLYAERLKVLNLQSLEHRRLIADLILCFNIIHENNRLNPLLHMLPIGNMWFQLKLQNNSCNRGLICRTFSLQTWIHSLDVTHFVSIYHSPN